MTANALGEGTFRLEDRCFTDTKISWAHWVQNSVMISNLQPFTHLCPCFPLFTCLCVSNVTSPLGSVLKFSIDVKEDMFFRQQMLLRLKLQLRVHILWEICKGLLKRFLVSIAGEILGPLIFHGFRVRNQRKSLYIS